MATSPTSKCFREVLLPLHGSLLSLKSARMFGHQKDTPTTCVLNCNFRLIWLKQLHCEKCWRYVMSFPAQRWPWFFTRWYSHHLCHPWRSSPSAELWGHWLPAWLRAEQHSEGILGVEAERKRQDWAQGSWFEGSRYRWNRGPCKEDGNVLSNSIFRRQSASNLGSKADLWTQRYKQEREHHLFKGFQFQDKAYRYLLNMDSLDPLASSVISYPHSKNGSSARSTTLYHRVPQ